MLVLSRKLGEKFQIGPDVKITIVKIDRNSVRIGIEAPDGMTVCRREISDDEIGDIKHINDHDYAVAPIAAGITPLRTNNAPPRILPVAGSCGS